MDGLACAVSISLNNALSTCLLLKLGITAKGEFITNAPTDSNTDILQLRTAMWLAASSRKHKYTYYSSPDRPNMYLLKGDVVYGLEAGGEATMRWVTKAEFDGEGVVRRLEFN